MRTAGLKWLLFSLTVLFVSGIGCKKAPVKSTFGEQFQLVVGQKVKLSDGKNQEQDLEIKFIEVKDDSRCPQNADCFWDGEAVVKFALEKDGFSGSMIMELSTSPNGTVKGPVTDTLGYTFEIISVTPYPQAGQTIDPNNYRVTMRVFLN